MFERKLRVAPAILRLIHTERATYNPLPYDPIEWKKEARRLLMSPGDEELHGGHRNLVLKRRGSKEVNIFWRQSDMRWEQILRGILLEDCMARHYGIPGRQLTDEKTPIEMHDSGVLMTRVSYVDGQDRYPYNDDEIASASRMLGHLHDGLRNISFEGEKAGRGNQWLHGDFARANVLFSPGSARVAAVIDYENAVIGPIAQDVGAFLRFLLVDTKVGGHPPRNVDEAIAVFEARASAVFENYPIDKRNKDDLIYEASIWAGGYLVNQNYGDLNPVRDLALRWIQHTFHFDSDRIDELSPHTRAD